MKKVDSSFVDSIVEKIQTVSDISDAVNALADQFGIDAELLVKILDEQGIYLDADFVKAAEKFISDSDDEDGYYDGCQCGCCDDEDEDEEDDEDFDDEDEEDEDEDEEEDDEEDSDDEDKWDDEEKLAGYFDDTTEVSTHSRITVPANIKAKMLKYANIDPDNFDEVIVSRDEENKCVRVYPVDGDAESFDLYENDSICLTYGKNKMIQFSAAKIFNTGDTVFLTVSKKDGHLKIESN